MSILSLNLLGHVHVSVDQQPITRWPTDKVLALLIYLAMERRPHRRNRLAELLWPGYETQSAANSLRVALHQLRQAIGDREATPPWLLITRQQIELNPAATVAVDALHFLSLLADCRAHDHAQAQETTCPVCLPRLQEAAAEYQGEFLSGFAAADSTPFEEWRRIMQEQLHLHAIELFGQLSSAASTSGRHAEAYTYALRQLALEPWQESAHRQVMRLLAQRGDRAAAIAQYNTCRQVLAEEFGTEPDGETEALAEEIRSGRLAQRASGQAERDRAGEEQPTTLVPSRPRPLPRHNLPVQQTPIVGRNHMLAEINSQLQQGVRLLTLVGPGGMGKTRLAIEVGYGQIATYRDGVFFVELAPIRSSASTTDTPAHPMATAVAAAIGLPTQGNELQPALRQFLRQKQLLLILDNFEHLLSTSPAWAGLLSEWLQAAASVQLLVTSREPLNLRGEQLYHVQPLDYATKGSRAESADTPAVQLFVQTAKRIETTFHLTDTHLDTVLRICQLVQGMPLGLELAAAQVATQSLPQIEQKIEQSAVALGVDWQDLPERQRSMRAVFAWSWTLLSAQEQRILRQSAVFRSGFTYSAAKAVTGATRPLLTRLIDKSLLQWQGTTAGAGRYTLHELLRQFADEELRASGEHTQLAARHGRYYLTYLAARGPRLARGEPKQASSELRAELDNLRQAWQWAVTEGRLAELDQATYSWWQFCQFSDFTVEGHESFWAAVEGVRRYLAQLPAVNPTEAAAARLGQQLLAKLLAIHADYLFAQGRDQEMAAQAQEAIRLGAASGGVEGETFGTFVLGRAAQELGQLHEAGDCWRRTLHLVATYQPAHPESELLHEAHWMAHNWLRGNELGFGRYAASRAHMVQALQICQALGKRRGELYCLSDLAWTDFYLFDFAGAEPEFQAALALAGALGYRRSEMVVQAGLGELLRLRGEYTEAQRLFEEAAAIAADLALPYNETHIVALLARLHSRLGNQTAAVAYNEQLAQILEAFTLPIECHLHHTLAGAHKAHCAGETEAALAFAEQAYQQCKRCEIPFRLVDTTLILGHTRAAAGQWAAATAAFQQALTTLQPFHNPGLAAEAQAGLAEAMLMQGDLAGAQTQVEACLLVLNGQPRAGYNNPFFIYLVSYRVLAANGDPRAAGLLQQGYTLLHEDVAPLDDESRQRFLTAVPIHRDLITAYQALQPQADKVTDDKMTGEPVTSTGSATGSPIPTLSPPLPFSPSPLLPLAPPPLRDLGEMPTVDFFTGRAAEVAQLTAWLAPGNNSPPARLISILGLGGMGKTTLAAHVVKTLAPSFTVVSWRSLLNAPPLEELLGEWLQRLARQQLATIPNSLDGQLRLLIEYLQQARCLLILDNVESLFASAEAPGRAGVMRAGYEGYDQLLQRFAVGDHQGTLLITSREQPYALNRLGRQAQHAAGRVRLLGLGGLDPQAGQALLQSNGLATSATEAAALIENYAGNPLALQIAAATIADFFGGDVAAFQQEEGGLFDGIRLVLDQQFTRLTPLEREILVWLAIERQAVTPATVRANFVSPVPSSQFIEALQALQSRALLETRAGNLTVSNVIIEYTTAYLIEQIYQEIHDLRFTIDDSEPSLVDAKTVNRQSKIENLFLNRFALLKAQAKEYVRQSQQRFILQPLADRLLANVGKPQLLTTVQQLLRILRQATSSRTSSLPGYAAGNLLNLLLYLEVDLAAYDFSDLQIWQAHLRNKNAAGLRLTGAQLRDPTFSDNFSTILAMAFHATDELLATGVQDGTIYLWQTKDWQRTGLLHGHTNAVRSLAFAPSAATADAQSLLASGGGDGRICLWHLEDGHNSPTYTLQREGYVRALAFSPDGTVLVSGSDDQLISFWQVATGELRQQCRGHRGRIYGIRSCAPLSSGPHQGRALIFSAGEDANIYVWEANSGEQVAILAGHQHPIHALACVSIPGDGAHDTQKAWLASADASGLIYLWNLQTFSLHYQWHEDHTVIHTLSFNATGTLLASAGDSGLVRIWELGEGRLEKTIQAHPRAVVAAIFSERSPFLLATCGYDHLIRLWNGATGQALQVLHGFRNKCYVAQFQPAANNRLATGHTDGIVRLWQVDNNTSRLQRQLIGHRSNVFTLAFSPDGTRLASGSSDATIRLWNSATGEHLHTLYGHTRDIFSVAFSPDGQFLVTASADQTIRLWETESGREVRHFATKATSWSAVFHPNGSWVASGDFDHQVRLWEVATGRLLQTWSGHQWEIEKVAFSPDGAWLASAGHDGTVRLWDVASGTTMRILKGHTAPLWSVAFSPDGRRLVSCGEDLTVRLWDLAGATGDAVPCQVLTGHTEEIFTAVFHPDGGLVASASGDGSVCFWETPSGALRHQLYVPGPYAGMEISGVTGLSEAQKAALRALGAVGE